MTPEQSPADSPENRTAVMMWDMAGTLSPYDPVTGRPAGLGDDFVSAYGEAARGRRVSSRLQLPTPPPDAAVRPWVIRRVDIDPLGHVNNAAQWAIVEESLPADGSRRGLAELEHRAPVDPPSGAPLDLVTDTAPTGVRSSWLAVGRVVLTAARWTPAP